MAADRCAVFPGHHAELLCDACGASEPAGSAARLHIRFAGTADRDVLLCGIHSVHRELQHYIWFHVLCGRSHVLVLFPGVGAGARSAGEQSIS